MEADGVLYMDIEVVFAIVPVQGRCLGYDKNKLIYRNLQRCTHGLQNCKSYGHQYIPIKNLHGKSGNG